LAETPEEGAVFEAVMNAEEDGLKIVLKDGKVKA